MTKDTNSIYETQISKGLVNGTVIFVPGKETLREDYVICPACGYVHDYSDDDHRDGDSWDAECDECGITFAVTKNIDVVYSTEVELAVIQQHAAKAGKLF